MGEYRVRIIVGSYRDDMLDGREVILSPHRTMLNRVKINGSGRGVSEERFFPVICSINFRKKKVGSVLKSFSSWKESYRFLFLPEIGTPLLFRDEAVGVSIHFLRWRAVE